MDIHLTDDRPTDAEQAAVAAVLPALPSDETAGAQPGGPTPRSMLLPALHAVHARAGWISPGAVNYISQRLDVPPAETYGVASFYGLFSLEPRAPRVAHICDDLACLIAGAADLCDAAARAVGPAGSGTDSGAATWLRSPCLGLCDQAPAMLVTSSGPSSDEVLSGSVDAAAIQAVLGGGVPPAPRAPRLPQFGSPDLRLLRRVGVVDPTSIDAYRAAGGYRSLRRALELGPAGVIREVTDSGLVGRGGAAFPTGRKWAAVAQAPVRPHYLVCNADESEPGTFKDRVWMEEDPFALIEAMTIAGFATGCERAYRYIRGEYPLAA
ncbi:MAG: NAD(P)H-dependent oxidoreductase subunit E, partial [Dehalococcoidia bacterium]